MSMFYLSVCLLIGTVFAQDNLLVNTEQGLVHGALASDGDYYVFYGVRYAGSTSGANRFKPPTPATKYFGIYYATNNSIVCAHPSSQGPVGVEDCLVVNIHTKDVTTPKPVMVILLGDEYTTPDTTAYSYRRLVEEDIVVVTMNYRLSIFGFLCLRVPDAPGNAGLKDVMQGLQWIKDNIAVFGGDPENIVLFGHGSGAAMADLITLSPDSSDLVHKAIIQSGSALAPWAVAYEPVEYAKRFGEKLNYTDTTPEELAQQLTSTDINLLSSALLSFEFLNNSVLFAPCLENPDLSGAFLTEAPINTFRSGNYNHIFVLYGYNDGAGTIRASQAVNDDWLWKMERNFTNFIQVDLAFESINYKNTVANSLKTLYFQSNSVSMRTIQNYLNYHGDTVIIVSVIRAAMERAMTSLWPNTRLMEFGYSGTLNSDWIYDRIPNDGARYGSLLNYIFDYDLRLTDELARTGVIRRFVLFAKTGNPTNGTNHVIWYPIDSWDRTFHYLEIGGYSSENRALYSEAAERNPHREMMPFWNNLYDLYFTAPSLSSTSAADKLFGVAFVLMLAQFVIRLL